MPAVVGEAASAMSEGVGLSFADDLLESLEAVRRRRNSTARLGKDVLQMLRARCAVEEAYAKGLRKVRTAAAYSKLAGIDEPSVCARARRWRVEQTLEFAHVSLHSDSIPTVRSQCIQ